ncbi:rhomboid family intramembrane serine protease [Jeotgalibacillus proteolyticus]|uniref:Rhomboid family intramembrane serine protease n=1 Tax=Jeotgalibacillus proteolyticus TaxID=2082395 RepID=A0A2S5GCB0_9BACL|nr:rhomboid family intramembrane serine protease [Jeotgalibacillus proteolyticus]PPA70551.1 rhomboid family intramembrane serine protease [Jeotgalibacillus proteolyticus]
MFVRTESLSQFIRFYPVVSALVVIHAVVFILTSLPGGLGDQFLRMMMGANFLISDGEWWRLILPIFAHGGIGHVLFNTFSLVLFAPALERIAGHFHFIVIYMLSGIIANVATWMIQPPMYLSVGASGAIFGLFGVYAAILFIYKERAPAELKQILLPILVISVIMTFFGANINITAHIAGLLAGFFIGMFVFQSRGQSAR